MKTTLKLFLCLLITVTAIMTFGYSQSAATTTFKDIGTNHRAYKEITYLAQGKIVGGNALGQFKPASNVTRAEAAAMIGRALNLLGEKRKTSFSDVGSSNFASGYIQSASEQKIISGYKGGIFKPNGLITRGEMAIMISRAFGYSFGSSTTGAIKALEDRGINYGVTGSSNASILRDETAMFLARAIDYTLRSKNNLEFSGEKNSKASSLNVRKGPSTAYPIIGSLPNNSKVSIGYEVGKWSLIKAENGMIGFVSNSYLISNEMPPGNGNEIPPNKNSLASQTLVIDPGHGGHDPGKVGFKVKEKEVVLDTALRLKKLLAKTPVNVEYTRETDIYISPNQRPVLAKKVKGTQFVSIHANAGGGTGSETYYYGKAKATNPHVKDSQLLAQSIQKRIVVALDTKDRGDKHGNFAVLRENNMPAALVELAFLDTKADNDKLNSPIYRQKAAEGIYLGVLDYYKAKGFNVSGLYDVVK